MAIIVMVTIPIVMATAQTGKVLEFWEASITETISWRKIDPFSLLNQELISCPINSKGFAGDYQIG